MPATGPDPATTSTMIDRLRSLDERQRAHYDMKRGFGRRQGAPRIPPEQKDLYASLPQRTVLDLRGGFAEDLLARLRKHAPYLTVRDFATQEPGFVEPG